MSIKSITWNDSDSTTISIDHLNQVGSITASLNISNADIKAFKCPNCGGNSYKVVNGKIVCEYCDTEFTR